MIADIVDISRNILADVGPSTTLKLDEKVVVRPITELETKHYLRILVADRPGVLAQISKILGDLPISVPTVIQKETDEVAKRAELVLMIHRAKEDSM